MLLKHPEFQLENLRDRIEEESEKKSDGLKALSKAQAEIQLWKSKFETEALSRIDELEGNKSKLGSRVVEAEETIESLNVKIAATEKVKHRIEGELEDLQMEYERTHAAAVITEKRGKNFEKVVGEWKAKADDVKGIDWDLVVVDEEAVRALLPGAAKRTELGGGGQVPYSAIRGQVE